MSIYGCIYFLSANHKEHEFMWNNNIILIKKEDNLLQEKATMSRDWYTRIDD